MLEIGHWRVGEGDKDREMSFQGTPGLSEHTSALRRVGMRLHGGERSVNSMQKARKRSLQRLTTVLGCESERAPLVQKTGSCLQSMKQSSGLH